MNKMLKPFVAIVTTILVTSASTRADDVQVTVDFVGGSGEVSSIDSAKGSLDTWNLIDVIT